MWISVILLLVCGFGETADLFTSDGVLVHKDGRARILTATWTVFVTIEPPRNPDIRDLVGTLTNYIGRARPFVDQKDVDFWLARMTRLRSATETNPTALEVGQLRVSRNRQRRGLIDIVGSAGKFLFGLAMNDDITSLRKLVSQQAARSEGMSHSIRDMLSVVNSTRAYVRDNADHIAHIDRHAAMAEFLARRNEHSVTLLESKLNKLWLARQVEAGLQILEDVATQHEADVAEYVKRRVQLERGFLTEEILPLPQLAEVLHHIRESGHHVLHPMWHYGQVVVEPMWNDGRALVFRAVFPGVSRASYHVFQLAYFPVPVASNNLRTIAGRPQVAVQDLSQDNFFPERCFGLRPRVCRPFMVSTVPTCESALVSGLRPETCNVHVAPRHGKKAAVSTPVDGSIKAVIAAFVPLVVVRRCHDKPIERITVSGPTLVDLPPQCRITATGWRLEGMSQGESSISLEARQVVSLPAINFSWPASLPPRVQERLTLLPKITVPLVDLGRLDQGPDYQASVGPSSSSWASAFGLGLTGGVLSVCLFIFIIAYICFIHPRLRRALACCRRATPQGSPEIELRVAPTAAPPSSSSAGARALPCPLPRAFHSAVKHV